MHHARQLSDGCADQGVAAEKFRLTKWQIVTYVLLSVMAIYIEEYLREDGSNPYKNWFDGLDPNAAAKVTTAKLRMGLGNMSAVKWFHGMGEYVIDWGPGYRIYLAKDGAH